MAKVLVTGANRGIGAGLVRAYASKGWDVIGTVRDRSSPGACADLDAVEFVEFRLDDLSTLANVKAAVGSSLDVLISNAALTGGKLGQFGEFDVERFQQTCLVNAAAPMKLLEAVAPSLAEAQGKAVMISSRLGANPFYGYVEYMASKTALNMLVKQASIALAKRDVTVVAYHPGWVETEATKEMGNAPLDPVSASDLLVNLIEGLSIEKTGRFLDPDGSELPIVPQQSEVKFYSKPKSASL